MPRRADHQQRRRQIIEALWRITTRGGLNAASFRDVAAEAGVSVRLVQYYFGTKDQLLLSALGALAEQVGGQITARLATLGDDASPREVVHAVLDQFLPTDDASRQAMLLFIAFHTASLTDPSLARAEALQVPRSLVAFLAGQLHKAQEQRATSRDIDPDKEATVLVTILTGLASGVLGNSFTVEEASAIIDYALDRLFQPAEARYGSDMPSPGAR
jgi:TetR/AcrR family transcriptional regulator, transcriptional repressor of bet genes